MTACKWRLRKAWLVQICGKAQDLIVCKNISSHHTDSPTFRNHQNGAIALLDESCHCSSIPISAGNLLVIDIHPKLRSDTKFNIS